MLVDELNHRWDRVKIAPGNYPAIENHLATCGLNPTILWKAVTLEHWLFGSSVLFDRPVSATSNAGVAWNMAAHSRAPLDAILCIPAGTLAAFEAWQEPGLEPIAQEVYAATFEWIAIGELKVSSVDRRNALPIIYCEGL